MQTSSSSGNPGVSTATTATFLGHPMGLFVLFAVEMWERFSYYGMRALLVLYLTTPGTGMNPLPLGKPEGFNPGPGWSDGEASTLYGWYTGLAYLLPIFGGLIADKLIGTHRSMLVGGSVIALGHVALAISGMGGFNGTPVGMSIFIFGLALIVFGTGHFKPSVSVMVGQLYAQGDPRRDGAFTIFYMGINLGAFLCAFVCGTLGRQVGWHWGFGAAAIGMLLGLGMYTYFRPRYLAEVGLPPENGKPSLASSFVAAAVVLSAVVAGLFHFGVFGQIKSLIADIATNALLGWSIIAVLVAGVLAWVVWFISKNRPEDRGPVITIFVYIVFNAFFWMAFEQAGSSINLFTDRYTDRNLGGFEVDTTWFQSVNAGLIFMLAPLFAWLWATMGRKKINPSQPVKIALGLLFLSLGFVFMVWGAREAGAGVEQAAGVTVAKASMFFILAAYFWHTVGELCLSPTGLSYVTKAAPARFMSLLMGLWFVSSFVANLGGGLIAAQVEAIEQGKIKLPWNFGGQADFFFLFVAVPAIAGIVILIASPFLKKMQRSELD